MIYFIGDSNLRGSIEDNQQDLEKLFNEPSIFEQAGSNEALKATLDTITDITRYSKIYIATLLNEVTVKGKVAKTRDEVIGTITKTQAEIVQAYAQKYPATTFIIVPPFLRLEPFWVPDKLRLISLSLKDHMEQTGLKNIKYWRTCQLEETDLVGDKIHLTEAGKRKLLESLVEVENNEQMEGLDWSDQTQSPTPTLTPNPTPSRITTKTTLPRFNLRSTNKRTRTTSESEDEKSTQKKGRSDLEAILAKLTSLSNDMKEERAAAEEKTEAIVAKLNINIQTTANNKNKIDTLFAKMEATDVTLARMKEDMDALENENQKNVIMVRRLKAGTRIPTNKAELHETLKTIADELLVEVGVPTGQIKFVALAYTNVDATKQAARPDQVPAFKIGFKNKEDAIIFKEKASKKAKDPTQRIHKVGFAYQQCAGTRIRSSILWQIATILKAEGKDAWVNSNSNKPRLHVKSGERYPREYSFIDAVENYGSKIPEDDLKEVNQQAKKLFGGQCKQLFIILKD
jgi:hypothetical protein